MLPNQLQLTYLMMSNNKPATRNINKAAVKSSVTNRPTDSAKLGEGAARPATTPNKPPLKRGRVESSTSDSTNNDSTTSFDDPQLNQLSSLLDDLTKDQRGTKHVIDLIMQKPFIKNCILSELFMPQIKSLQNETNLLKDRIDEMKQYSRRTCLIFSRIPEEGTSENTDKLAMNVINLILPIIHLESSKIGLDRIERTHRVGPRKRNGKPRDIIVRFLSYRDRATVFYHKRNLKNYNHNPSTSSKVFINEAMTKQRSNIMFEARKLARSRLVDSVWTYDSRIIVKMDENRVTLTTEDDLEKLKTRLEHHYDERNLTTSTPVTEKD